MECRDAARQVAVAHLVQARRRHEPGERVLGREAADAFGQVEVGFASSWIDLAAGEPRASDDGRPRDGFALEGLLMKGSFVSCSRVLRAMCRADHLRVQETAEDSSREGRRQIDDQNRVVDQTKRRRRQNQHATYHFC